MTQRGGKVVLCTLANVQQATIEAIIKPVGADDTLIHTDKYSIYARPLVLGLRP